MRNIIATGDIYGEQTTIKQVSKVAAKKAFSNGETIYLQSSNMSPFGVWCGVCPIKFDADRLESDIKHNEFCIDLYRTQVINLAKEDQSKDLVADYEEKVKTYKSKIINAASQFESIISEYRYYNCYAERGNYVHFYIKVS